MRLPLIAAALAAVLCVPAQAQDAYAQLYTDFMGPDLVMTVIDAGPDAGLVQLAPRDQLDTQFWTKNETASGWLVLSALAREGEFCLDVVNGGDLDGMVEMTPCANVSGQHWSVYELGGGRVALYTEFLGPDMCLDVVNGGPYHGYLHLVPCGDYSGQAWTAEEFVD